MELKIYFQFFAAYEKILFLLEFYLKLEQITKKIANIAYKLANITFNSINCIQQESFNNENFWPVIDGSQK